MKKKYAKLISVLLAVMLLVTSLSVVTMIPAAATTDLTLYVRSPGNAAYDTKTDADGTADKPFETVYDLVTWVNTNYPNLTADDTVKVIVKELENYNTDFDSSTSIHNMTVWSDTANTKNEASMAPHKFKMVITSPEGEKNHLAFSQKWGTTGNISNVDLMIGGPTVFDNIILVAYSNGKNIAFEGASVEITENCDFQYTKGADATKFGSLTDMKMNVQLARGSANITKSFGGATYTINNGKIGSFYISASRAAGLATVYSEDVNIIANNSALDLTFIWGSTNAKATSTFQKNLNINIKDVSSVTNTINSTHGTATVTGALQVIYPEDITFDMSAVTNLTAGSKYYLVNKTGNSDALTFTATAGVYNVAEGLTVSAVDAEGNGVKTSKDGVLDLTSVGAGTYSIVEGEVSGGEGGGEEPEEPAETYDYYVKSPGYNAYGTTKATADGTAEKPFETVYDLITYVNDNTDLGAGDIANAIILQRDDYNTACGATTLNGASAYMHSATAWSYTDDGKNSTIVPAHTYTLNICSPAGQQNCLAFDARTGKNMDMKLNGPVIFDNVIILNVEQTQEKKTVCLEGNDAKFTENCTWAWAKTSSTGVWASNLVFDNYSELLQMVRAYSGSYSYSTPVNIELNAPVGNGKSTLAPFQFYIPSSRANNASVTYSKDVNITVNNADAKINFTWGIGHATPKLTFGQNLNINIKDAAAITNTLNLSAIVITGGLQVMYPEDVTFDMSAITNITAGSKYYLVNKTGNADVLTFTATAGLYNVAEGVTVTALDSNNNAVKVSSEGVLDLREAGSGTYSIVEGEVSGGGEGGGEEPEEPETTVTKEYSKYITYRSDLDNTRTKLKANGDVNVVYFGGSVTAGSGASNPDTTSWRGLTGSWIKSTFPNANVTNYDQAVGETGTYLGCYRVARDIIGKNPDLLFIEYSINDYYNHTGYARASVQFETIVRQVKEALPNCDIVTILVTDFNQAQNLLNGELHAAAKAHSDIAAVYGLPVINVGSALADTLGALNWVPAASYGQDTVWGEYVQDLVHPLDKGYQVYFNVIKEYLSNNLIMEYNGETAFTELTELPTLVNKYLMNGDVTFIKPSQDLITVNTENTTATKSRKLQYRTDRGPGSMPSDGYGYDNGAVIWFGGASYIDCGDVLEFEFTGTEIVMIPNTYDSKNPQYLMVSIDGGEPYRVDQDSRPFVLATNLSSGKHTIKFTELAQTASLIIGGFYTRDFTKATNKLNICDLVKADEVISGSELATETDFFDYSNNWEEDAADIDALKQILLNK